MPCKHIVDQQALLHFLTKQVSMSDAAIPLTANFMTLIVTVVT